MLLCTLLLLLAPTATAARAVLQERPAGSNGAATPTTTPAGGGLGWLCVGAVVEWVGRTHTHVGAHALRTAVNRGHAARYGISRGDHSVTTAAALATGWQPCTRPSIHTNVCSCVHAAAGAPSMPAHLLSKPATAQRSALLLQHHSTLPVLSPVSCPPAPPVRACAGARAPPPPPPGELFFASLMNNVLDFFGGMRTAAEAAAEASAGTADEGARGGQACYEQPPINGIFPPLPAAPLAGPSL